MSIVITGNPGVGKHTITKKISEKLNFPIVDINIVAKIQDYLKKMKIQMMWILKNLQKFLEKEN